MLSKLHLSSSNYSDFVLNDTGIKTLSRLNKINVFIGQNNSGKSRFLRSLFADETYEFELQKNNFSEIHNKLLEYRTIIRQKFDEHSIEDADSVYVRINELCNVTKSYKKGRVKEVIEQVRTLARFLTKLQSFSGWTGKVNTFGGVPPTYFIRQLNKMGEWITEKLQELFPDDFDFPIHKIYVPILRGLRPMQWHGNEFINTATEDNYQRRTIRDYFKGLDQEKVANEIFTGYSLYTETKKLLLGNKEGRQKIKSFEEFLSNAFFEGETVTLIPDINNDVLLIGIGEEERPVYELGDGIQSIIILLYPLFFHQGKNLLVFIEEPENNLHPGLQRLFLETLLSEQFKTYQYFITTHSNHFLDLTLDLEHISVYTFKKDRNNFIYHIENTSNSDIKVLELIGARASSVFLSNCTIWVEGITDRLYLKKYLDLYQVYLLESNKIQASFKEDFHYSFVEYGGGNIVHWSFTNELGWEKISATKISSKIFVLADKDSSQDTANSAKNKRLATLKRKLGKRFHMIDGREIENILSPEILIKTIKKLETNNDSAIVYDPDEIIYANYKDEKLGKFIESHFKLLRRKYAAKSGTISCKLDFCRSAISVLDSYEHLSTEAKKISTALFNFIRDSNAEFTQ